MKELKLNVPEEQAQEFAKAMAELIKKHGIEEENKELIESLLPITERVKTFEDACNVLGKNHHLVTLYESFMHDLPEHEDGDYDVVAYLKLRIITAALNEGWEPQFTDDEYRYYPWFWLYTQDEVDKMDEEERSKLLYVGGHADLFARCGLSFAYSNYGFSGSLADLGSRLAFKNSELAKYAGTQFLSIWSEYVFKPVKK